MSFAFSDLTRRQFLVKAAVAAAVASASGPTFAGCGGKPAQAKPHRWIDADRCIGCGQCVPLCPMGAITLKEKSSINADECVECGTCWRVRLCPVDAIQNGNLQWPRVLRDVFSNPLTEHKSTGVAGRGTAEIKTNDSENRYGRKDIGVLVEMGRPVLGARFSDVEKAVKKFLQHGYRMIEENPVYELIADHGTGTLRTDVLNEKVMSCVIEFLVPRADADALMKVVRELSAEVKTVFNVSVALRADGKGRSPFRDVFGGGVFCLPQGKVNIGLASGIPGGEV